MFESWGRISRQAGGRAAGIVRAVNCCHQCPAAAVKSTHRLQLQPATCLPRRSHVVQQECGRDGRPVVQPRAAVAVPARAAGKGRGEEDGRHVSKVCHCMSAEGDAAAAAAQCCTGASLFTMQDPARGGCVGSQARTRS